MVLRNWNRGRQGSERGRSHHAEAPGSPGTSRDPGIRGTRGAELFGRREGNDRDSLPLLPQENTFQVLNKQTNNGKHHANEKHTKCLC